MTVEARAVIKRAKYGSVEAVSCAALNVIFVASEIFALEPKAGKDCVLDADDNAIGALLTPARPMRWRQSQQSLPPDGLIIRAVALPLVGCKFYLRAHWQNWSITDSKRSVKAIKPIIRTQWAAAACGVWNYCGAAVKRRPKLRDFVVDSPVRLKVVARLVICALRWRKTQGGDKGLISAPATG